MNSVFFCPPTLAANVLKIWKCLLLFTSIASLFLIWPHHSHSHRTNFLTSFPTPENEASTILLVMVVLLLWFKSRQSGWRDFLSIASNEALKHPLFMSGAPELATDCLYCKGRVCRSNLKQVSPGSMKTSRYIEKSERGKWTEAYSNSTREPLFLHLSCLLLFAKCNLFLLLKINR